MVQVRVLDAEEDYESTPSHYLERHTRSLLSLLLLQDLQLYLPILSNAVKRLEVELHHVHQVHREFAVPHAPTREDLVDVEVWVSDHLQEVGQYQLLFLRDQGLPKNLSQHTASRHHCSLRTPTDWSLAIYHRARRMLGVPLLLLLVVVEVTAHEQLMARFVFLYRVVTAVACLICCDPSSGPPLLFHYNCCL